MLCSRRPDSLQTWVGQGTWPCLPREQTVPTPKSTVKPFSYCPFCIKPIPWSLLSAPLWHISCPIAIQALSLSSFRHYSPWSDLKSRIYACAGFSILPCPVMQKSAGIVITDFLRTSNHRCKCTINAGAPQALILSRSLSARKARSQSLHSWWFFDPIGLIESSHPLQVQAELPECPKLRLALNVTAWLVPPPDHGRVVASHPRDAGHQPSFHVSQTTQPVQPPSHRVCRPLSSSYRLISFKRGSSHRVGP